MNTLKKYMFTKEHINKYFFVYYTFCFSILMGFILLIFSIKGNSFIWTADGYNQFYPVLCYTSQWLKDCLVEKTLLQFDFNIGLGDGIIPTLNIHGFGDPFFLLSVFISAKMMPFFASFLVISKIYLSGVAFSIYCLHEGKEKWCVLAGSLLYSFSSFSLCYGLQFWSFIMPMITFPLLIFGVDELLKDYKKIHIPLMMAAFLQATYGFYFLYMEIIFGIIYFLISSFFVKKRESSISSFVHTAMIGIISYSVGMCMAGIILIPSVIAFFNSTRSGGNIRTDILYEGSKYLHSLQNLIIPRAFEDVLGITVLALIAIILIIKNKRCSKYKIVLVILVIGFVLPVFGFIMSGFSNATDRWTFIMQFFFAIITVNVLNESLLLEKKLNMFFIIIIPAILCLSHMISKEYGSVFRGSIYFLLVVFFMILLINIRKEKWIIERGILFFVMVNLLLNIFMIFGPEKLGGSGFRAGFKTFVEVEKELADNLALEVEDTNSFYRIDVVSSTRGEALILDYYGTAEYFSMINKNVYDFYSGMMVSPGMGSSSWVLKNLDGRMILNSLLAGRYIEDFRQDDLEAGELRENNYSLPLGYIYSKDIRTEDFLKYNPMERQEIILQAVVVDEKEAEENNLEDYQSQSFAYVPVKCDIEYINIDREDKTLHVNNQSRILLNTEETSDGENYIYLEGFKRDFDVGEAVILKIGNKEVELAGKGIDDVMINIGISNSVSIEFTKEGIYEIEKICMYHIPENYIKESVEKLKKNSLQKVTIDENVVRGEINSKINGLLFLSIPYGDGWEARIDGEITDIYKANLGFMAIPMEQGEHVIELRYTTPGIVIGSIFTFAGWLFFGGVMIKRIKKKGCYYQ